MSAADLTFIPGHEVWTAGGQPFTDGLLVNAAQFNRALQAADAQAAAAKGKKARSRPTAPSELVVDVRAFFEGKAGETGARKLAAKGEDVTKMKREEIEAARAEHAKVVQESAQEAAAKGESPGAVIKTDIGGQVGEVYERAMVDGHIDVVAKGRRMRLRFSRHTTAILAVPTGIDLKSEVAQLGRVSRDVRKLNVPTTEKALKDVAERIERTGIPTPKPTARSRPIVAQNRPVVVDDPALRGQVTKGAETTHVASGAQGTTALPPGSVFAKEPPMFRIEPSMLVVDPALRGQVTKGAETTHVASGAQGTTELPPGSVFARKPSMFEIEPSIMVADPALRGQVTKGTETTHVPSVVQGTIAAPAPRVGTGRGWPPGHSA